LTDDLAVSINRDGEVVAFPRGDLDATAHLLADGVYDRAFHRFLGRVLSGSDTYVDVGANIGQFVMSASRHLNEYGRIYAFEPNKEVFPVLEANAYMMRTRGDLKCEVYLHPEALGPQDGTAELFIPIHHAGRSTLSSGALSDVDASQVRTQRVSVTSLDRVLADLSHIRLIKIDVEGTQHSVLAGASQLINEGRVDFIDLEFVPPSLGASMASLIDWLTLQERRGAVFWTLNPRGRLRHISLPWLSGEFPDLPHLIVQFHAS